MSVLLSMAILFIGSGVNIMRCAHTGTVKIMTVIGSGDMGDMSCDANSSCMTIEHVELSPTLAAQTFTCDFHAVQPLLAILPALISEWLMPLEKNNVKVQPFFVLWKSPPRAYLNFIQVLQI